MRLSAAEAAEKGLATRGNLGELEESSTHRILSSQPMPRCMVYAFTFREPGGRIRIRSTSYSHQADGSMSYIKLPREHWTLLKNVHPGYIEWEQYEENLQ